MQKQIKLRDGLGLVGSSLEVLSGASALVAINYSSSEIAYPTGALAFAGLCLEKISSRLKENLQEKEEDLESRLSSREKEFAEDAKIIKTEYQKLVDLHKELSILSQKPANSEEVDKAFNKFLEAVS